MIVALVAFLVVINSARAAHEDFCARVCPRADLQCPSPCPSCPVPRCPTPVCPPLPGIPACPVPQCPSLPQMPACQVHSCPSLPAIPACPTPLVNLSCPVPVCPKPSCPSCPQCLKDIRIPVVIPPGYTTVEGLGTYKLHGEKTVWKDANVTCGREGAYLVVPNSQEEVNHLLTLMVKNNVDYIHVGFHDSLREGEFESVLGHPMNSIQRGFWNNSEPDGGTNHNCVYLHRKFTRILDESCQDREKFVCERLYV